MEMEVNARECVSPTDKRRSTGRVSKSPRKVRPASVKTRGTEQPEKSRKHEERGMTTTVLQGKVKALKEKQMKEKKPRGRESPGSEDDVAEDALVSPQLRTYLTEDLLDSNKQELVSGARPEMWGVDELWGTCDIGGSTVGHFNNCQMENLSNYVHSNESSSQSCSHDSLHSSSDTPYTTGDPHSSLSLAERVERNRKELRCKLNRTACHNVDNANGGSASQGHVSKDASWLFPGEMDADFGVSIAVTDDCRELSVRHEQAKQLLHRARMKAKGASPLRASHCVLPHPHSQPPPRRATGGVTDGGSQSDSSSSDYCSWHKGSRGSSPSHVRFQDESERDVEERYRERQHVPQTASVTNTPPPKRQANGFPSWTEQLSPSGHGQCGSCGSNIKVSGPNPAATHGTNLRSVQLGSKITQDGSFSSPMGVKPSPHWILPSQPWRVHTELIRETHIGGDSTADSSGEEDGSRTHRWGTPKLYNSLPNTPEHGATLRPTRSFSDAPTKTGGSHSEKIIKGKNGTSVFALESRFGEKSSIFEPNSVLKFSESNPQLGAMTGGYYVDPGKTGSAKIPQDLEAKTTRKPKSLNLDKEKGLNTLHTEIETGNIVLNLDGRQGAMDRTGGSAHIAPTVPCIPFVVPPSDSGKMQGGLSNRVPIPPPGKAPTAVLSRMGRLAVHTEGVNQQLLHGGNKVPVFQDKKGIHSNLVPNSKVINSDVLGDIDNHHLSTSSVKLMESRGREASSNCRKQSEEKKSKEAKENRSASGKKPVKREPRDNESSHPGNRQVHCERNNSAKELRESGPGPQVSSQSREETLNEGSFLKKEKCTEKPRPNRQQSANNERIGFGPVIATKDRCTELAQESKVQSDVKKGDLRSGMRKIFSSIGLTSRPKLERFQSSSLEQISPPDFHKGHVTANGDSDSYAGCEKLGAIKKSPSLQSLKLMSPFNLPRRASSVQNLLGKSDRSAAYITGGVNTAPRRALSVEDIGSPAMARALGKVAEVYPDGTRLLELHCLEKGGFGFSISSENGRPDSGIYVQDMSDANTAKLYSGLLRVGDEILEVNGAKVSTLGLGELSDILHRESVLSVRVLHQRRTKC
ncbi:uncharacterized protein KIAA1614 homolog isoform X2 [Dendrobates tinctorius]|uniref:uncharacterized protein KIAA1614 homolog isoform X2 n=1 Tax=Dendrobates tinctorius TaxID=92724 RepID=UPI003CC92AB6